MVIFCESLLICHLFRFGSPCCAPIMNTCLFFWLLLLVLGFIRPTNEKPTHHVDVIAGEGGLKSKLEAEADVSTEII